MKTIEAFLRGYIFFNVNGEKFYFYGHAQKRRTEVVEGRLYFMGWNIWHWLIDPFRKFEIKNPKGWRGFYERIV